jgi:N-formylglutamate deformylase
MPIIYHIPHASRYIPEDQYPYFCISQDELDKELHLMTDHFTDHIFKSTASLDDLIIEFPVSRLVVDPERFSDDNQELMSSVGMGAVYTKRHNGELLRNSILNKSSLLELFYKPIILSSN